VFKLFSTGFKAHFTSPRHCVVTTSVYEWNMCVITVKTLGVTETNHANCCILAGSNTAS